MALTQLLLLLLLLLFVLTFAIASEAIVGYYWRIMAIWVINGTFDDRLLPSSKTSMCVCL